MRPRSLLLWLGLLLAPLTLNAAQASDVMTIATRDVPPFAMKDESGNWQGISIELWRTLATKLDLEYRFREMGLKAMLDAVEHQEVDAAVAGLTITSARERRMDFTHPFLSSGLGIAVRIDGGGGWLTVSQRLFSVPFLQVIASLLGLLLLVGMLVWLFERRHNAQFGGTPTKGIGAGLWWSAVTMTTVGYGDKAPQSLGGRLVAMVWMFAGILIVSSFTAAITTALTVGELGGKVRGKDDLPRARIATVADTTSAQYLTDARLKFHAKPSLEDALDALAGGTVDAVVYDKPILSYQIHRQFDDRLRMLSVRFERQDYGIALPSGSALREKLNQALLESLHDPAWDELLFRYLGATD
ncbi:transporter substrate-binding domain-containing protein [Thiocystis violacea]|uniref:transporter substrate-binding domain-containing protein n=1 Tax=Thiocystis violacea TaxID=13725 RepID=UPI00237A5FD8|nr:transporter substrate-binding domain-containing protein [Thiocystis violacea]